MSIIGIDASKAATNRKTGIDNTAYQIILGLEKIDAENKYYLYTNAPLPDAIKNKPNFEEKLVPFPKFWNRFRLPLALLKDKPEKFLQLTSNIPPCSPEKTAVLIHDLAFKFFPEAYSKYELMLQENALNLAIKKAKTIIFTSEANASDFRKFYSFPKNKITVIPLAYNDELFKRIANQKNIPKIDVPYFLTIGRLEKRKNTAKIIEAFEIFKQNKEKKHKLVLVGKPGFGSDEINDCIKNSRNKDDIIVLGYVEDEDLPHLYNGAEIFIYTSLYEGFGLPMLESMACGTPVLTSNIPTLKEIAGNSALLVDPTDPKKIAEGICLIEGNKSISSKLISSGLNNVKNYSWDKTSLLYLELITRL